MLLQKYPDADTENRPLCTFLVGTGAITGGNKYYLKCLFNLYHKVFARAPEHLRIGDLQDVLLLCVALKLVAA